jgi:hypothetical protein
VFAAGESNWHLMTARIIRKDGLYNELNSWVVVRTM